METLKELLDSDIYLDIIKELGGDNFNQNLQSVEIEELKNRLRQRQFLLEGFNCKVLSDKEMVQQSLDITICCTVTFFSKKRRTPPNLNNGKYCSHLVIKDSEQLLGVNFIDGEDVIFDQPIRANALPVNEDIDYSALQDGTEFLILEGSAIVGEGIVKEIFQHKTYGKK